MTPADFRLTDSLRKTLRKKGWQVTCDQAFETVMRSCAAVQRDGQASTWITEPMVAAYTELNRLGIAHSIEVRWEGELVGGLYGIAIGRLFHGESMFHTRTDASKVAFAHLVQRLSTSGYVLIDCQLSTPHLASLGAFHISRDNFLSIVHQERDLVPAGDAWTNPFSAGS
jgi:leucyl/phenylalanyl-tRNA--protein transferase